MEALIGNAFLIKCGGRHDSESASLRRFVCRGSSSSSLDFSGDFSELAPFAIVEGVALALPAGFVFFLTRTPLRDFLESFFTVGAAEIVLALGTGGAASGIGGGFAAFSRAATALRRYMRLREIVGVPRRRTLGNS